MDYNCCHDARRTEQKHNADCCNEGIPVEGVVSFFPVLIPRLPAISFASLVGSLCCRLRRTSGRRQYPRPSSRHGIPRSPPWASQWRWLSSQKVMDASRLFRSLQRSIKIREHCCVRGCRLLYSCGGRRTPLGPTGVSTVFVNARLRLNGMSAPKGVTLRRSRRELSKERAVRCWHHLHYRVFEF